MFLIEIIYTFFVLIGSSSFLWNAFQSVKNIYYKNTVIDICLIMFWFNLFHIHLYSEKWPKLFKILNIIYISLIASLIISADIIMYINNSYKYSNIYLYYAILDFTYLFTLAIFRLYDYRTLFISTKSDLVILLGFQYGWFISLISQVIPIYAEKRMTLTNDFALVFWSIFIAEEIYRHHTIDKTRKEIMIIGQINNINETFTTNKWSNWTKGFYLLLSCLTIICTYFFTEVNTIIEPDNNITLGYTICSFLNNLIFDLWTFSTFRKL